MVRDRVNADAEKDCFLPLFQNPTLIDPHKTSDTGHGGNAAPVQPSCEVVGLNAARFRHLAQRDPFLLKRFDAVLREVVFEVVRVWIALLDLREMACVPELANGHDVDPQIGGSFGQGQVTCQRRVAVAAERIERHMQGVKPRSFCTHHSAVEFTIGEGFDHVGQRDAVAAAERSER